MQSIKRLLYSLKRRFGTPIDFYRELDTQPDILTGQIIQQRFKFHINQGIFLDQTTIGRDPLTKILGQLTGVMEVGNVAILIDASDFPRYKDKENFKPHLKDYIVIDHQRYEIVTIKEVDDYESLYLTIKEYKGSEIYEHHDIHIKDKLNIIQWIQAPRTHIYLEELSDSLSLDESYLAYDPNDGFTFEISNKLDIVDYVDVNYPISTGRVYTRYIYDNIGLRENYDYQAYLDHYFHDVIGFDDQLIWNRDFDPSLVYVKDTLNLVEKFTSKHIDHNNLNIKNVYITESINFNDKLKKLPVNIHKTYITDTMTFIELPIHYERHRARHIAFMDQILFSDHLSITQPPRIHL